MCVAEGQPIALNTLEILLNNPVYCFQGGWLLKDSESAVGYTAQLWHQLLYEYF